jgi:hypothetical protein
MVAFGISGAEPWRSARIHVASGVALYIRL